MITYTTVCSFCSQCQLRLNCWGFCQQSMIQSSKRVLTMPINLNFWKLLQSNQRIDLSIVKANVHTNVGSATFWILWDKIIMLCHNIINRILIWLRRISIYLTRNWEQPYSLYFPTKWWSVLMNSLSQCTKKCKLWSWIPIRFMIRVFRTCRFFFHSLYIFMFTILCYNLCVQNWLNFLLLCILLRRIYLLYLLLKSYFFPHFALRVY